MPGYHSIAFYNLENLFDCTSTASGRDPDFHPEGYYGWNRKRYLKKVDHLALAMSRIGIPGVAEPPVFIGVCEVENEKCLKDLVHTDHLHKHRYGFILYESSDRRGMNVGLLYKKAHFRLLDSVAHPIDLKKTGSKDSTRDILHVEGELFGERIHLLVNHWPSRTLGVKATEIKRKIAGEVAIRIVSEICDSDPQANILLLGDFNEPAASRCMRFYFDRDFENLMASWKKEKKGSMKYKGRWMAFDQFLLHKNLSENPRFQFQPAKIFDPPFLTQKHGKYRGSPKRTFHGKRFQEGYSDHYPVYLPFRHLAKESN